MNLSSCFAFNISFLSSSVPIVPSRIPINSLNEEGGIKVTPQYAKEAQKACADDFGTVSRDGGQLLSAPQFQRALLS